ncbi:MAG TPA: asparagine synthase (glutamine-hydrolyzing) [Azospira sp.]|nr:asparagine synthase (glutamine-hydrolyzing) [Azospira sp.]
MCGIAGWLAPPSASLDAGTRQAMLAAIAHRGPDGEGIHVAATADGRELFLGHRRLAIIDPAGGRQPMHDTEAGLTLVFNGEIYNFRELRAELALLGHSFALDSDTEVLLRAYRQWGDEAVHRLRGMFAFALWDAPRQRLFLARDRFGEKPLFLMESGDGLFFASEIKALLCLSGRPGVDLDAVWDYLAYRYVPGPRTLFAGIRKLPPATAAVWEGGRLRQWRYWTAPDRGALAAAGGVAGDPGNPGNPGNPDNPGCDGERGIATPADDAAVVPAFLARLDDAVAAQMVSDVPFGAFLSGGLDSSMIVALMSRHCAQVQTFSVGFRADGNSELPFAAVVARQFGTRHQEIEVGDRDLIDDLPKLIGFRDAPVSEPSDVAIHRMALAAAKSVKMVLTGEGSDEILGGYPKHVFERFAGGYQRLPGGLRQRLIAPLVQALPYRFRRIKTAVANLDIEDRQERYARWFGALSHAERARLSVLGRAPAPAAAGQPPFDADDDNSALRRILYFDQTSWLPDNLLERGDRMTMAASIEARVPFLDHRLAAFVSALPDRFRVRGLTTKWLLREAGRQLLPPAILTRPKVGFRVPVDRWFRNGMRDFLLDHLQGGDSLTRAYYAPQALDRIIAEHLGARQNHEKLLWSLLNLEIWHRQYAHA